MARKSKTKATAPPVADVNLMEEESIDEEEINEIVDNAGGESENEGTDSDDEGDLKNEASKPSRVDKESQRSSNIKMSKDSKKVIPFMDTFYHLSSEDSLKERSIAARDLIHHCFFSDGGINYKDSAYALNRLLNGLCSGRAASRQGFASCLTSFLRLAQSMGNDAMKNILKELSELKQTDLDAVQPGNQIRHLLRKITDFSIVENSGKNIGSNKNRFGKMKGIEERDHVFGRLFGILAVVRSGMLKNASTEVLAGYIEDLLEIYHYKTWTRETSVHALVELVSSLDKKKQIFGLTNDVIIPKLFLTQEKRGISYTEWLEQLTAEQIALGVHLQQIDGTSYAYPLDQPLLTKENSIQSLSSALASTSSVVYPRCHVVWTALWTYLTNGSDGKRSLKAGMVYTRAIEDIVRHVVVAKLLGKQEGATAPTHERRTLALQIVCTLCASSDQGFVIPTKLIETVLCKDVVNTVFLNVLCASGGVNKTKANVDGTVSASHHLKPLTTFLLEKLVSRCCECGDVERQVTFAKAFLSSDPRFDVKTKTNTVGSILMLIGSVEKVEEDKMKRRTELWGKYISFLEEEIVSAENLHTATAYIELMHKLAKCSLNQAPADEARRVVRFFMSAAFFDCSDLSIPGSSKTKKSKKDSAISQIPPQELSSGLRINELLKLHNLTSISFASRKLMSARFYSLLSDFISVINAQGRRKDHTEFYGKASRPETIYRALSEICGISTLLESSGAHKFDFQDTDRNDQMEQSRKSVLKLQAIADKALVKECDGNGDAEMLRTKSVFVTSCASLMMSLYMQLSSCGGADTSDDEADEDDEEDVVEAVHEFISDLADSVTSLCALMEGNSKIEADEGDENPLAAIAGLLVNILSSPVGGEDAVRKNAVQASASKLTRETVKLMWSGIITAMNTLHKKLDFIKTLLNEDVMTILIESVCGEDANNESVKKDDQSVDESNASSDDNEDDVNVFVDANKMKMDEVENNNSQNSNDTEESSKEEDDGSVELDPIQLENMLLEDSDIEMSNGGRPYGVLEHHAGADKALAQLIKLKQDARKASQTERERIELCNQLRCATLLESLFSSSIFKNDWVPIEAVLGSIVPILRYRRVLARSIQSSTLSGHGKKVLNEKNALLDKLSMLLKDRVSKYRCSIEDSDVSKVAMKASADIYAEMKHSLNLADCSCCSIALITALRCIPDAEENEDVKNIFKSSMSDWATRKASKIHSCAFEDLTKRMPSLASTALITPLIEAAKHGHSSFIKCESIRLLAAIFHECSADETLSGKARSMLKESCGNVSKSLSEALADSSLQKAKHRDEVMHAVKHFVNFVKVQKDGLLTEAELSSLRESLSAAGDNSNSAGMKQLCLQVCEFISGIPRRNDDKTKRSKVAKTPKGNKKMKTKK